MNPDRILFAASCAAPFVLAYGAARLWLDRRRLFRRAPPHLGGRVPVECGVGALSDVAPPLTPADLSFVKIYGVKGEEARENWARHHYAKVSGACGDHLGMRDADVRAAMVRENERQRPSPADNARRYTEEESTW